MTLPASGQLHHALGTFLEVNALSYDPDPRWEAFAA